MTAPPSTAVGLSVGTTTLAAVTADRTVTSHPVIRRAGHRIADFVTRVGDPVGIVAADGSLHSAATLLADALHELARSANAGRPVPTAATVAYPAHWKPVAVEALGRALRRIPVWSDGPTLVADYAAVLTALQPQGLPARGVIAVCDFGASATTITVVDAGTGPGEASEPIGEPVRCAEFSGDLIDRALLTVVLTAAGIGPDATGTWSIRALATLRGECRAAKERLSAQPVAIVSGAPAGVRGSIRITRPEIDEMVRGPLTDVVGVLREHLQCNGIDLGDLTAVAAVGGMAAAPAVTATLSEQLRVPIITVASPALAAATGAAQQASRLTAEPGPAAVTRIHQKPAEPQPGPAPLAWSQAVDLPELVPQHAVWAERRPPRPRLDFAPTPVVGARTPWHRRPLVLAALVLAVTAGAGTATVVALRSDINAVVSAVDPAPASPPEQSAPPPRSVVAVPPPPSG